MKLDTVYCGDCADVMRGFPTESIDLTVTSPPYDDLREYHGFSFDFEKIATELFRITKDGGVVVWVVGDRTIRGSETGTSFRQALFFKEIGFRLHDTMIWRKTNPTPIDPRIGRYTPSFEYMFVFSKGKLKYHNLQRTSCKTAGRIRKSKGSPSQRKSDGGTREDRIEKRLNKPVKDTKILDNVIEHSVSTKSYGHPATFPEYLAELHILTWSNIGETILDPMAGSGTTLVAAKKNKRSYIGIEISSEYLEIISQRLNSCSIS